MASRALRHRRTLVDTAAVSDEPWVVLIGEGADADETLNFLRALWPDVECDMAFTRSRQRRKLCSRSVDVDAVAPRVAAEDDR